MRIQDARSVEELFRAATDWTQSDGEGDYTAVWALRQLATREVLERAIEMTKAEDPRTRAQGLNILGQLGIPERAFPEECSRVAIELLNRESDPDVLQSLVVAIGHLRHSDPRGREAILGLAGHSSKDVRQGVAFALGGHSEEGAVRTLIKLTNDPEAVVRDWATFGLGQLGESNTPEIRQALYQRLSDDDLTIQYEAMCGLVRCGDLRVISPLIEAISNAPHDCTYQTQARKLVGIDQNKNDVSIDELTAALETLREA